MDQKSCFKAILTAGLTAIVIPMCIDGDEVCTNMEALEAKLTELGAESVLCVLTTTSCFSPRAPDKVEQVAALCAKAGIGHVINNAYGLQSSKATHMIDMACRCGRVDAIVQSTDKNFLVPVGGAIVAGPNKKFIEAVSKAYPGIAICQTELTPSFKSEASLTLR